MDFKNKNLPGALNVTDAIQEWTDPRAPEQQFLQCVISGLVFEFLEVVTVRAGRSRGISSTPETGRAAAAGSGRVPAAPPISAPPRSEPLECIVITPSD